MKMFNFTWRNLAVICCVILSVGCSGNHTKTTPEMSSTTEQSKAANVEKTSGPAMGTVCQSDALLLSYFPIKKLFGTPLPKVCCESGVLPKGYWQCEHDWPSSDAIDCSAWQEIANALSAQIKTAPAWMSDTQKSIAADNLNTLHLWHKTKYACIP